LESTAVKLGRIPMIRGVWCRVSAFGSITELGAAGSVPWGGAGLVVVGLCWASGWFWFGVRISLWSWVGCDSCGTGSVGVAWHKAMAGARRTSNVRAMRLLVNRAGSIRWDKIRRHSMPCFSHNRQYPRPSEQKRTVWGQAMALRKGSVSEIAIFHQLLAKVRAS
jgi:hypothetical protein